MDNTINILGGLASSLRLNWHKGPARQARQRQMSGGDQLLPQDTFVVFCKIDDFAQEFRPAASMGGVRTSASVRAYLGYLLSASLNKH